MSNAPERSGSGRTGVGFCRGDHEFPAVITVMLAVVLFAGPAFAGTGGKLKMTRYAQALKKAKETGKPVLLYFTSST